MNTEIIQLFGIDWWARQRWGSVHTEPTPRANCWYDPSAIELIPDGSVKLKIQWNPKDFIIDQGDGQPPLTIHADWGVGLISSFLNYGFGRYTWKILLPLGSYLWPALWLHTDKEGCNEEIDVAECYSETTQYQLYKKQLFCKPKFKGWNIQSCLHAGVKLMDIGVKIPDADIFKTSPVYTETTYELNWTPSVMSFTINGVIYRYILDRKTLDHFAQFAGSMYVIINTHIDGRYYQQYTGNDYVQDMIIRAFKFTPANMKWYD